jgi:hypothetical protein
MDVLLRASTGVVLFGPAMHQLYYYHAQTRAIMMTAKSGIIAHSTLGDLSGYGARVCQSVRELVKDHFSKG